MKWKAAVLGALLLFALLPFRSPSQDQRRNAVSPAKLEPMQNMGAYAADSGRPAFLPAEWGSLVSVQRIEGDRLMMFLQNEKGEIYLVRLVQRGQYFYLDTYDHGGVALVIRREQ
ncbi:MAG: hypothetical protein KIT09_04195 [Bryobacteraceae bacterium]|nr:hypothetical protein [Bryobacteraceae bacterium]